MRVAKYIRELAKLNKDPSIGIICGSGLGDLAEKLEEPRTVIPYAKIPGFKTPHGWFFYY